jgi:hypothetical protein
MTLIINHVCKLWPSALLPCTGTGTGVSASVYLSKHVAVDLPLQVSLVLG